MAAFMEDAEMIAIDHANDDDHSIQSRDESDKQLAMIRAWKHASIGSNRQKELIAQRNLIPQLVNVLRSPDNVDTQLLIEIAILLGSLARGSRKVVDQLVEAEAIPTLLGVLRHPQSQFVEACLRCLRSLFLNDKISSSNIVFEDPTVVTTLLNIANASVCTQECVATLLSQSCRTDSHRSSLLRAGAVEAMAPLLFSSIPNIQLCGLAFFSALCYKHCEAASTVSTFVHLGRHLLDQFVSLVTQLNSVEMQLSAAKCITTLCRAGAISMSHNVILYKVMPTLVRICKYDALLGSTAYRVKACETLAYLIDEDVELQRLTHWNNQCLKTMSSCINTTPSLLDDEKYAQELQLVALSVLAALASNDEEIRKKETTEVQNLLDHLVRGLNSNDSSARLQLICAKCLHSLSRSVEQLRTTFLDRSLWRRLLELSQNSDEQLATTASSLICNLVLEFSPNKAVKMQALVEAGCIEVMSALTSREELSLRLNGIWCLMNLAFDSDDKIRQSICDTFSPEQILRLLTETAPNSPIVLRILGLLRNLLGQRSYIDRLMEKYGASVIQAVIFVLEGDYSAEAKEQALCVLSNIAEGDSAKVFIMSNEDVLRKVTNYMMHANTRLQIAATSCLCNLVWKEDPGSIERQAKLKELGVGNRLQQLLSTNDSFLFEKVKTAMQHMSVP